jgi:hypothetical protein
MFQPYFQSVFQVMIHLSRTDWIQFKEAKAKSVVFHEIIGTKQVHLLL